MADETGALNAIKDSSAPAVEAQPDFARNALDRVQKARADFDAITAEKNKHYKDLLASLDSRKNRPFNPMLMKLAAGMLQPTKTGSFGESLGYAAAGMSDQAEKEFAQQQQDAKLRFELQSKIAEQKQQDLSRRASQDILGGVGFGETPSAPAALPISPVPSAVDATGTPAEVMSVPPPEIAVRDGDGQIAPPEPVAAAPIQVAAAPAKAAAVKTETAKVNPAERAFKEFTEGNAQYRANVKSYAPEAYEAFMAEEKRRLDAAKAGREERETQTKEQINVEVGGAKAVMSKAENKRRLDLINKGDIEAADKIHAEYGLPSYFVKMKDGDYRAKSPAEFEAEKAEAIAATSTTPVKYQIRELGGSFEMLPRDYMALEKARKQGPAAVQKWVDDFQGITGKSAKSIAKPPSSVSESEASAAAQKEIATKEATASAEQGIDLMKQSRNAADTRNIWLDLKSYAESNPKIFDALKDPTISQAFLRTVNNGVATPFGSISIDTKDLANAVGNYTDKEGKKLTDKDLAAYNLALQSMAKLTVQERKLAQGQGPISNNESTLFERLNVVPSDTSTVIRLKAEVAIERTNTIEKLGKAFYQYKKQNKGATYDDFVNDSPVFKTIRENYDNKLEKIREANSKYLGTTPLNSRLSSEPSDDKVDKDAVRRLTGRK